MIWDHEIAFLDLLVKIFVILTPEREASTEKGKEQDSAGPYVSWRSTEFLLSNNLRSHIGWCATEDLDLLIVWYTCAEPKVDYLNVPFRVKHHVLQLYVSMAHALAVTVLKSTDHLPVDPPRIVFVHSPICL